jgi:WD40 repeat protein
MKKFIAVILVFVCLKSFSQSTLQTVIQKGHELAVTCIAMSPDSNFSATGSKDKLVKLWELSTGREVRSFFGHELSVTAVDFSSDGKYIISGSNDKTVKIWNVGNGNEIHSINANNFITDVAFDPQQKFFVVAGYNRSGYQDSAIVYDYKTKQKITKIRVNADQGRGYGVSIAVSADGKWVSFGEDNRVASIYNTTSWQRTYSFDFAEGSCGGCSTFSVFSPDNNFLYMVSHNGPLKKYNMADGKLLHTYADNVEDATGLAIASDGQTIAVAAEKQVFIYSSKTGNLIATLQAEDKGDFHKIAFTADAKRLMITSDDNTAFAWDFSANKMSGVLTGFLNERDNGGLNYDPNFYWQSAIAKYVRFKNAILISQDGKSLIKGKFGTKVKQWDIASGKSVMEFSAHEKAVLCYDLSANGEKLLTGGGDGKIILWDLKSGDTLKVIRSYREPIFDIHFNTDETKALSSSWDASMKVHDLKTGELQSYFEFESYAAYNVLFHPNDLYIVSARLDNSLQLWEIDTKTPVRSFVGHTDVISSLHFSADKKTLMSTSWDGSIRFWDIDTGLMTKKFKGHRGAIYTAIYSPDAKLIYSGGADRKINVWDVASGKILKTFEGHQAEITSVLLGPDNKILISHSLDGVTKFWDMSTGKEFFEHIHIGEKDWMAKNPDGFFNGTDKARTYIHFVSGTKTFSVDQFFNDFYRPDLLPQIFRNRGKSDVQKSIQGKLKNSLPPTVKVALVPAQGGKADLFVRVIDNGSGVSVLKVFHNGKSVSLTNAGFKLPSGEGQQTTYKEQINLVGGQNIFTVTAVNKDNIESDPESAEIFSDHPSKSSTCHILAVGINQYKNTKLSLNYAKPDAEAFGTLLMQNGNNLFKAVEVHSIYDEDATREKILKKLDELSTKIHPEDVFIFFFAGHGSMVDNQFYFIPTESSRLYDASSLNREAIEASVLQEKFSRISALKQLIIMDACQSGGSVELLATRGAGEEKAIAQLSRSAGIHVMASAGSEQFATEFSELGHGLFTYVLIQALQGKADGAPKDGKVTIYELKSYIDDQVPEMTRKLKGRPQFPNTFSRGQDFPVVVEEE